MKEDEMRERLAAYAHEAWSGWMQYLFSKCNYDHQGSAVINPGLVARWQRQMNTPYAELPAGEKQSDRDEADKMLAIIMEVKT